MSCLATRDLDSRSCILKDARELVYNAKQLIVYATINPGHELRALHSAQEPDVNTLQERYFRELKKDCAINSASDAYYVSAIACFCLTFIFPPAVIGAALCVYRAKKCQKGGRK